MRYSDFKRWLYKNGRPNFIVRVLNRGWAWIHALGIAPNYLVTLAVMGRRSGKTISFPLAMVVLDGQRYLVSMLGEQAAWVKNIRAAQGQACLLHGRREQVRLVEVSVKERAPILKLYLQRAPGARPHVPVDKDAPLEAFEAISAAMPVFRVMSDTNPQNS